MIEIQNQNAIMGIHIEKIKCPECNQIQDAEVQHTNIWNIYVKECDNCKYTIMESEWSRK